MKKLLVVIIAMGVLYSCSNTESTETGKNTVNVFKSLAGDSSAQPFLFTDKYGILYMSWIEKKGNESMMKFSAWVNETWTGPSTIASGNNWFVNWADYPVMVADGNQNLMAHYLEKSDTGKFTYDVKYITSQNNGGQWSSPKVLHDDGKLAEHGFVSMATYGENYFVSWLDGRNAAMEGDHSGHDGHHGEMTLRGAVLKKDGTKVNEWELDKKVCDCCQTSVAVTAKGPIVVYRDRSDEEIRDMSIVRLVNNKWTKPKTIYPDNWKINGCPVNGPRAAAIGNNLAIAWFSMSDTTGQVKIIFSKNGGESFEEPVRIDEGKAIGRVAIVMLDEQNAAVCWMEGSEIKFVKVNANGEKEASLTIATSAESRSSGFPQMTKSGDKLYFAWTDSKEKKIKTAWLKL